MNIPAERITILEATGLGDIDEYGKNAVKVIREIDWQKRNRAVDLLPIRYLYLLIITWPQNDL
jgi:hypothetical protein